MSQETLASYFTPAEVAEIADKIMGMGTAVGRAPTTKAAATFVLRAIDILRDRLNSSPAALELVYANEEGTAPQPLTRFVRDYLSRAFLYEQATTILNNLQADVRQYFFQKKIPFDEPEKLPQSSLVDLTAPLSGKPSSRTIGQLKEIIGKIVQEYVPGADAKELADKIYARACENLTGDLDIIKVEENIAEIIARREYPQLMLRIGMRDPTPWDLGVLYSESLPVAYKKLGMIVEPFQTRDREKIIIERMNERIYQEELKVCELPRVSPAGSTRGVTG